MGCSIIPCAVSESHKYPPQLCLLKLEVIYFLMTLEKVTNTSALAKEVTRMILAAITAKKKKKEIKTRDTLLLNLISGSVNSYRQRTDGVLFINQV